MDDGSATKNKEKSATPTPNNNVIVQGKPPIGADRGKESPVSSEGKNSELKQREKEYQRKWPKHHTSSSSRDVRLVATKKNNFQIDFPSITFSSLTISPWDEDAPASTGDYRRRTSRPSHHDSHHSTTSDRYARPPQQPRRRMNSCDEEYDEEYERRQHAAQRARGFKGNVHRSREILNSGENPNWRYPNEQWSDDEDDERMDRSRQFDRNALRSTYGPPYDKREPKSLPYDRRVHDKRSKYYRPNRSEQYEYDPYDIPPPSTGRSKSRKEFDDYEAGAFERGSRESRSAREFFYDRERKSFDSNESYESGRGHRMGSGEIYGSYESRGGEYRDRERYFAAQGRPRRSHRSRGELNDEDSEEDPGQRRITESTGSLQRPGGASRSSKHIQLDDDIWGSGPKQQQWKRPSSADRLSGSGGLSGSENESEKRQKRKSKPPKGKEVELRSNYATIRHPSHHQQRREYFDYEDESATAFEDEPPRNISPRSQEHEYYGRRRPPHGPNQRTFSSSSRSDSKGFNEYSKPRYPDDEEYEARKRGQGPFKKSTSRDLYVEDSRGDYYQKPGFDDDEQNVRRQQPGKRSDYSEELPTSQQQQSLQRPSSGQSQGGNGKFNFDGFESDFIASPKQADNQQPKSGSQQKFSFESELLPSPNLNKNSTSQQRLRFSENVSVSKFDSNSSSQQMFEDDFAEWTADTPQAASSNIQSSLKKGNASNLKNNSFFARHENLKKSESVNIFARKNDEDPFENDDFFASEEKNHPSAGEHDPFNQWGNKNNFANFDDNKNI